jgi:hypothetical protein
MSDMEKIAKEINRLSAERPIGSLQDIRKDLKKLSKLAARSIFTAKSIQDDYAFHLGGRTELQFNIGRETVDGVQRFRHGVAFSLEPSRTLPRIDTLLPKISRFNEFVRTYPDELARFRMWHYENDFRSGNYGVGEIPSELAKPHVFIFLGHLAPTSVPNYELVLNDFDTLLSLYRFVEGEEEFPFITRKSGFRFSPGCTIKPSSTQASLPERIIDINLRHNTIQLALYEFLAKKYGPNSVGTEIPSGAGTRLDVVLNVGGKLHVYEIKTAQSARACIREALAQLLEYSYWPGSQESERLIIVGEPESNKESDELLSVLRNRFLLPVYYRQFNVSSGKLV